MSFRKYIVGVVGALCALPMQAAEWTTMFAYNNVTQIAVAADCVYGLSDGALFSVDKQSEQISKYDSQSGLHGTGISCIYYDQRSQQLIIGYTNGKIDMLRANGAQYVGGLYDKDMTQRKDIYNITVYGRTAYLSTHYGIQTLDLRNNTLVDSYWLRPNGQETTIADVLIQNDSIYAFATDSLYCAALSDNLVDYRVWQRELRSGRITPDTDKGTHYIDGTNDWRAGGAEGIVRITPTEQMTYKPDGPLVNKPYRVFTSQGQLMVVQGGRWASQDNAQGILMCYKHNRWLNIPMDTIKHQTGASYALDFMNVAFDPKDESHYFVTSYGTGLFEFRNDSALRQYLPAEDNTLGSAAGNIQRYTRLDCAVYDNNRTLWLMDAGDVQYPIVCMDSTGTWHGFRIVVDNTPKIIHTPAGLIIDQRNSNYKWFGAARAGTCVGLLDDNGTLFDDSDDQVTFRKSWQNQFKKEFRPDEIRSMMQDHSGRIWIGTEQGPAYIMEEEIFTSDNIIQPDVMDQNGENPLLTQRVMALCEDKNGYIWIGTQTMGVYVLSPEANEIKQHFTTDNTAMPSNSILSLACDTQGIMYVGTAEGLVCCDANIQPTEDQRENNTENLDMGKMQQWRLHYSYSTPIEIAEGAQQIYALADGALFSVDRESEEINYWNKSTGLHGSTIVHIAYNKQDHLLVIGYADGRIDLLNENGTVRQMPELYMKGSSIPVTINAITVGSHYTYLSMPFGIVSINTRKAEIADTYYIGAEASSVEVLQVVELGDSLYAFTDDRIYNAALQDNLVDYRVWHRSNLPTDQLKQATAFRNELYTLQHNTLYRRRSSVWEQVLSESIDWIHSSEGQLLVERSDAGLFLLTTDDKLDGITGNYRPLDAIYSQGTYWLGVDNIGLVRLNAQGEQHFVPEGPISNFGYHLHAAHNQIYTAIGGRWADLFARPAQLSIYDNRSWRKISYGDIYYYVGDVRDPVSVAVDPSNAGHFFVATYASGVIEFVDYTATTRYDYRNSTIREAAAGVNPNFYTRTDGALMDSDGNLWVLNATNLTHGLHVRTATGQWKALPLYNKGQEVFLTTPGCMIADLRNANRKWFIDQRSSQGVFLFDDGGTPTYTGDDKCVKRSTFTDQNGAVLNPANIYCIEQDLSNRMWIGTPTGVIVIPANVDFFTSDACRRIIIPRNDGTGLGDYLLANERVNCLAADGGNRMWIGTENSGLYLIEDDTITVAHFTVDNSLLPSNSISSISIEPMTGEVWVGTAKGIASYRSDASAPQADLKSAYAFPNPVRPNYGGNISIAGLMENTIVNIVDEGGNLVCKTKSHGGMAVWDGKLWDGRRATPGVYTALCNEPNGGHTVVKILVIR